MRKYFRLHKIDGYFISFEIVPSRYLLFAFHPDREDWKVRILRKPWHHKWKRKIQLFMFEVELHDYRYT
jgi:hypothetical protein